MENNLFQFATKELSQDAFLCWCLNWYNDPKSSLFPMASELLALLGESELPPGQTVKIEQQKKKIDILVILEGQNRVLIIEDKTISSEHDDQIASYRAAIRNLNEKEQERLGIDASVSIRTAYFKTGFHYDNDRETVADAVVDGPSFLSLLDRYAGLSEILDDYRAHLRQLVEWYRIFGRYDDTKSESFWEWNISQYHIAQHNLMRDMLRERFPVSLWERGDERYKIRIGNNVGGRPWTELTFLIGRYPACDDQYFIFWRIDTDRNGPYISLRFYDWFGKKSQDKKARHTRFYENLRDKTKEIILTHPELGLDWAKVKGGYTGGYYESTLLSICLKEPLCSWEQSRETVKRQVLTITDCFLDKGC